MDNAMTEWEREEADLTAHPAAECGHDVCLRLVCGCGLLPPVKSQVTGDLVCGACIGEWEVMA